jgi:ComEC/Rec2-related protein
MRSFKQKIHPSSVFAWICFGFLLADIIDRFQKFETSYALIIILLLISSFYLLKKQKIVAFFIGYLLFFAFSGYEAKSKVIDKKLYWSSNDISLLSSSEKISRITLLNETRRGIYNADLSIHSYSSNINVRYKTRDIEIPSFICNSNLLKLQTQENENEILSFRHWKCNKENFITDKRKLVRQYTEDLLERGKIYDTARDISLGLLFGDSSYLSKELKERSREGGTLHLFAASGLHIGVLAGFLFLLCKRIPFLNYYTERLIPLFVCFLYLYLLNFPVSLLRAYQFATFITLAKITFREIKSTDLLLYSALGIRIIDKENYLGLSFLLSFTAVAGILYLKEELDTLLFGEKLNLLQDNITLSLSASLGTYPTLLYFFSSFSFGSIFINLLLVPLTSIILPLLYISLIAEACFIPILNEILWINAEILLRILAFLSDNLGESIGFYKEFKSIYLLICLYILVFIGFFILRFIQSKFLNKTKDKRSKIRFVFPILGFILFPVFFIAGYTLGEPKEKISRYKKIGNMYDIFKMDKIIYINGECKYSGYDVSKSLSKEICSSDITEIHVQKESCLTHAIVCNKTASNGNIFFHGDIDSKFIHFYKLKTSKDEIPKLFIGSENVLFFAPHKDSLDTLLKYTRNGNGIIILNLPYKSRDNSKEWNDNRNLLGVSVNWTFYTRGEWALKHE